MESSLWGTGCPGHPPHHSGFLVGKVVDVVPCEPTPENKESGRNRFLVKFSAYARVSIEGAWTGERNPVKYASLEKLGIDPSKLDWEPMPEIGAASEKSDVAQAAAPSAVRPLTMAEAKQGLALTFNVAPEAIEILVRG